MKQRFWCDAAGMTEAAASLPSFSGSRGKWQRRAKLYLALVELSLSTQVLLIGPSWETLVGAALRMTGCCLVDRALSSQS